MPRVEKPYEKAAWILPFAVAVIIIVGGMQNLLGVALDSTYTQIIIGMTFNELQASNPSFFDLIVYYVNFSGLSDLTFAFLIAAISVTAYRRGEKWAWYTLWSIPVFFLGSTALIFRIGASTSDLVFPMVFVVLSLLGLLLPIRKVFPGKSVTSRPIPANVVT